MSVHDGLGLFVLSLFNCVMFFCRSPSLWDTVHTAMARYILFVLKVLLNTT